MNRLQSPEYLKIVRKCFRDWSAAESETKRQMVRNLLVAAATSKICTDDVVRLFIEWIEKYSEPHFKVLKDVYQSPGSTRADIWNRVYGAAVRGDSAEADLFKLLVHELSLGHIIRQHRTTDSSGNFLKQPAKRTGSQSPYVKSAFDDEKPYELTELGKQFVLYTMNEVMPRLTAGSREAEAQAAG